MSEKNPFLDYATTELPPEAHERGNWKTDLLHALAALDKEIQPDGHSPADWLAQVVRQVGLATPADMHRGLNGDEMTRYRRQLVRAAAYALKAVESFDKKFPLAKRVISWKEGNEGRTPPGAT